MAERWQVGMVLSRPELPKSPWREILVTEPRKREGPRMELQWQKHLKRLKLVTLKGWEERPSSCCE